jgi:hypothetical protein
MEISIITLSVMRGTECCVRPQIPIDRGVGGDFPQAREEFQKLNSAP